MTLDKIRLKTDQNMIHENYVWPFFALVAIFFFKWKYNDFVAFKKYYQMGRVKSLVILIFKLKYPMKCKKK